MLSRLLGRKWFYIIVTGQISIFAFDVSTAWDDVSIGFLYAVPTLMAFFVGMTPLRLAVVSLSVVLIGIGCFFPLPENEDLFVFAMNRALAVITVMITGIMVHYRVRLETTLSAALAKERRVSAMQRSFVSMVSHEFRTPLTIIDGEAYRLAKKKDQLNPADLEKRVRSIRLAVARMVKLIEKILYTSRAFENKINMKVGRVNLWTLIKGICDEHQQVSPTHKFDVDIYEMPVAIKGDQDLLSYVFDNLIGNAIKYSPSGSVVEIRGWTEGQRALIAIRDQGMGIPKDDQRFLFEPYFRGSNASGVPGSGVGLFLVASFVKMHGGRISVKSEVGQGATFTVALPPTPGD